MVVGIWRPGGDRLARRWLESSRQCMLRSACDQSSRDTGSSMVMTCCSSRQSSPASSPNRRSRRSSAAAAGTCRFSALHDFFLDALTLIPLKTNDGLAMMVGAFSQARQRHLPRHYFWRRPPQCGMRTPGCIEVGDSRLETTAQRVAAETMFAVEEDTVNA